MCPATRRFDVAGAQLTVEVGLFELGLSFLPFFKLRFDDTFVASRTDAVRELRFRVFRQIAFNSLPVVLIIPNIFTV